MSNETKLLGIKITTNNGDIDIPADSLWSTVDYSGVPYLVYYHKSLNLMIAIANRMETLDDFKVTLKEIFQ